jgi:hypothetical protein
MKDFFGVEEKKYVFEWGDVSALLTVLSVALIVMGYWWAPIFGLINCTFGIMLNTKGRALLNAYITQIALIILNLYFLN